MRQPPRYLLCILALTASLYATPSEVTFSQDKTSVDAYAFIEVQVKVSGADARNPFTDVSIAASFNQTGAAPVSLDGFCDSQDGSLYRVRFMPTRPGEYEYSVRFRQGQFEKRHTGTFRAVHGNRRGILRVDPDFPWHFLWEGTGEHHFWNGTTAFLMMGWQDDATIQAIIDRLGRLKVNHIRLMLAARTDIFWGEPVTPTSTFRPCLCPWVSPPRQPACMLPSVDHTRFDVAYWQKFERMLHYAWTRDMIINAVFDWNDSRVHPAAGSGDELRYISATPWPAWRHSRTLSGTLATILPPTTTINGRT